jgi:hypothetical protein
MTLFFLSSSMGFGSEQFLVNVCRFGGVPLAAPFAPRPSIICRVRVPARVPGCLVSAIHPSSIILSVLNSQSSPSIPVSSPISSLFLLPNNNSCLLPYQLAGQASSLHASPRILPGHRIIVGSPWLLDSRHWSDLVGSKEQPATLHRHSSNVCRLRNEHTNLISLPIRCEQFISGSLVS